MPAAHSPEPGPVSAYPHPGPIRVLRVIARMNVGGPAHHVSLLSGRQFPAEFDTRLVSGTVGPGEASFDDLAEAHGARLTLVPELRPEIDPANDARALRRLAAMVRAFRPDIVHTHTAKAGMLGRLATLSAGPRPIVVHTYHGHVLEGYFSPRVSAVYRAVERGLASISDRLIGVSRATVDDLVRLGVAPPERFEVIPLGLQLERFLALDPGPHGSFRREMAMADEEVLAVYTGRLVPIKRLDVLLEGLASARRAGAPVRLALAGDGPERPALEARARELGVAEAVRFLGFRRDLPDLLAAADMAVLSSDNEGTPVSLIEAAAAARPCVSTRAGGVADVVTDGAGLLTERGDAQALGAAIARLAGDGDFRLRMGAAGRAHVAEHFTPERLVHRVAELYHRLLATRR